MPINLCNVKRVMCNVVTLHVTQSTLHKVTAQSTLNKVSAQQRGVTLIELLMVLVISAIAMFPLAIPFVADRAFWGSGKAQAESQRDGEMVMRAIARFARESKEYPLAFLLPGPNHGRIQFVKPSGEQMCFEGGPNFPGNPGKLYMGSLSAGGNCVIGQGTMLIDGNRSKVTNTTGNTGFSIIPINSKLVRIRLEVTHEAIAGSGRQENEVLETEIFLRNGS